MLESSSKEASQQNRHLVAPELLAWLDAFPTFPLNADVLAMIRAAMASGAGLAMRPPLTPEQENVACEERFIPGPARAPDVRVLVYTPPAAASALKPAYLHMHGGGFVIGNPEINDGSNRRLSAQLGCVVVSVDYRLAPDTVFPGALEDCYAALSWLHANAQELGVDRARIAIGGESAGSGHAAALALYARDKGEIPICLQMLDCPMLDDRTGSTIQPHGNGVYVWPPENNRFGRRALLGMAPGGPDTPKYASPAREADLSGLPPAYIAVGALDMFLEEDMDYARRLIRAGVPTELHVIPGVFHGGAMGDSPQGQLHFQLLRDALSKAFAL